MFKDELKREIEANMKYTKGISFHFDHDKSDRQLSQKKRIVAARNVAAKKKCNIFMMYYQKMRKETDYL